MIIELKEASRKKLVNQYKQVRIFNCMKNLGLDYECGEYNTFEYLEVVFNKNWNCSGEITERLGKLLDITDR